LRCSAKSLKSLKSAHAHCDWLVGKCDNLERALSLQNVLHLPTTQCACADFRDFAKQRNGSDSREKDLYHIKRALSLGAQAL
jgi:hypothetical protein